MTPLSHQSLLFHCPVYRMPKASPQLCFNNTKKMSYKLFKCDTYTNFSTFEQILAVHSDNFAGFDTCKLSFFLRQGLCSRKIELYDLARLIGAVTGRVIKTPVLLILQLRPLKNLLASGIQTLTGQETTFRLSLRCSTKVSIVSTSLKSIFHR